MKRKLALFMVLAMLISLVPMNVFAGSTNRVDAVDTIKKDLTGSAVISFEESVAADFAIGESFKLSLKNADILSVVAGTAVDATVSTTTGTAILKVGAAATTSVKETMTVTVNYKVTEEANVTVDIDGMSSGVTSQEGLIIAKGAAGATKTTIGSVKVIGEATSPIAEITIEETAGDSLVLGNEGKLKLPANFEWVQAPTVSVYGGISSASAIINSNDKRELTVKVLVDNGTTARGGIILSGATITPTTDAKVGEVNMAVNSISGDWSSESVKVADYKAYGVTVKLDKETVPTLVSGQHSTNSDSDDTKLQTLVIKEDVTASLLGNRKFKVTFPSAVKITGYDGTVVSGNAYTVLDGPNYKTNDKSEVEFLMGASTSGTTKAEYKIKFWVSIDPSYAGDIEATLSGKALPQDYKIVLGKAVKPATFTVVQKDVKLGLMKQAVGDIVVTEPKAGYWAVGTKVVVTFPTGITVDTDPTIKVTKGDIEIKDLSKVDSYEFTVKSESSAAPAEVSFTGGTVKLDRTLAEGEYKVNVAGSAVVKNFGTGNALHDVSGVGKQVTFRVITPAPGDTKVGEKVVFTIDSMDYMVGAAKVTSDVAPYINEQGRTMLPLRAFASALNVPADNIVWNEATRSVVIFKGDATIKVVIGEMKFTKNGTEVGMDTMAVIKNGRTMMPLRAVAQALGATIVWDEATRTVTIN